MAEGHFHWVVEQQAKVQERFDDAARERDQDREDEQAAVTMMMGMWRVFSSARSRRNGADCPERQFHAGRGDVAGFPQSHLDNSVVIDPEGFADGVLGDFETAINVAPEFRDEIEA